MESILGSSIFGYLITLLHNATYFGGVGVIVSGSRGGTGTNTWRVNQGLGAVVTLVTRESLWVSVHTSKQFGRTGPGGTNTDAIKKIGLASRKCISLYVAWPHP